VRRGGAWGAVSHPEDLFHRERLSRFLASLLHDRGAVRLKGLMRVGKKTWVKVNETAPGAAGGVQGDGAAAVDAVPPPPPPPPALAEVAYRRDSRVEVIFDRPVTEEDATALEQGLRGCLLDPLFESNPFASGGL
jgi:hypothetical protein